MATDFGRLYLIQGELQTAAEAAALAAATRLFGTGTATETANAQVTATFDSTTDNDNRFNLRISPISSNGGSELLTTIQQDYFTALTDAQSNVNGGQTGRVDWLGGSQTSMAYPKYVRVQITAETPVMFAPLLTGQATRPTVTVSAIAGVSAPICSACGIEGLAIADQSGGEDPRDFGLIPGGFYTLFLVRTQRTAGAVTPAPIAPTTVSIPYVVLNHTPGGQAELDVDGSLFEFGAAGLSTASGLTIPGIVTIDSTETAYTVEGTNTAGQDVLCGLNTRFGVDPSSNNCNTIAGGQFPALSTLYPADADIGAGTFANGDGLQDFATEYHAGLETEDGLLRRVITVAVVDAADTLTVLNFRQFLIEASPVTATVTTGLNTGLITGAFRAQYIGAAVPVRCGGIGGMCRVTTFGIGRTVLH